MLAEVLHHGLNLLCATLARTNHIDGRFLLETILLIYIHKELIERHAVLLSVSSNLADEADRCW